MQVFSPKNGRRTKRLPIVQKWNLVRNHFQAIVRIWQKNKVGGRGEGGGGERTKMWSITCKSKRHLPGCSLVLGFSCYPWTSRAPWAGAPWYWIWGHLSPHLLELVKKRLNPLQSPSGEFWYFCQWGFNCESNLASLQIWRSLSTWEYGSTLLLWAGKPNQAKLSTTMIKCCTFVLFFIK